MHTMLICLPFILLIFPLWEAPLGNAWQCTPTCPFGSDKNTNLFIPQTVFSCRGSNGVVKGALKGPATRGRCVRAVLLVNTNESETDLPKHTVKLTF